MNPPKPPRPPPSDPTLRSRVPSDPSMRAAGMTRPQSSPELRAAANERLELNAAKAINARLAALESDRDAWKAQAAKEERHRKKLERALGVDEDDDADDDEPVDGTSDPPPGSDDERRKKQRRKKKSTVASDSWQTKWIGWATFAALLAKTIWDAWHGGGK